MRQVVFIVCALLMMCAGVHATDIRLKLPVNAEVVSEDVSGTTWRQNARLKVPYVAAVNQIKAVIGQQGWRQKQELTLGNQKDRCLLVFAQGKTEITVMIWKVGIAETGFSWGVYEKGK